MKKRKNNLEINQIIRMSTQGLNEVLLTNDNISGRDTQFITENIESSIITNSQNDAKNNLQETVVVNRITTRSNTNTNVQCILTKDINKCKHPYGTDYIYNYYDEEDGDRVSQPDQDRQKYTPINPHKTNEQIHEKALKYNNKFEFRKNSRSYYNTAKKRKILDRVCQHMGPNPKLVRPGNTKWTSDVLREEALKYDTRQGFKKANFAAYKAASSRRLLPEICQHMRNQIVQWSDEMLQEEALKYSRKTDFNKGSHSAYVSASTRGSLNEICKHMTPTKKNKL